MPGVHEMTGEEIERARKNSTELMEWFLKNNISPREAVAVMIFQICLIVKASGGTREDLLESIRLTFDNLPELPERMGG